MSLWKTGCDSDWKEGFSKCAFERTDRGTAIFRYSIPMNTEFYYAEVRYFRKSIFMI